MANSFLYKEKIFQVGDTILIDYRIRDGEKERIQEYEGILIGIKGQGGESRMMTVRKMSKSGVGIERIIPLSSPFVANITVSKKSTYQKAKLYFLKDLSDQQTRQKLYKQKKTPPRKAVAKKVTKKATKVKTPKPKVAASIVATA